MGERSKNQGRPARTENCLTPLLSEFLKSGLPKVLGRHYDPKLAVRVEIQKPRFSERGDLRWLLHVYDQDGSSVAILLREVYRLWFHILQDAPDDSTSGSMTHCSVEWLMWELDAE